MISRRTWWAICGLALATCTEGAGAPPAQSSPEQVLQSFGLARSGKLFILEDEEADFLKELDTIRPLLDRLDESRLQILSFADQEAKLEAAEQAMGVYNSQIRMLDGLINQAGRRNSVAKQEALANRRVLMSERTTLQPQLEAARRSRMSPMQQRQMFNTFTSRRQEFVDKAREVQPLGEKVRAKYAEIAKEFKVKDALKQLRTASKARVDLGPTPSFNDNWKSFLAALNGAKTPDELMADAQKKQRAPSGAAAGKKKGMKTP
jgi:hypothetical protein